MAKYTKELLEPIVKSVFTLSDVCRELGKVRKENFEISASRFQSERSSSELLPENF